MEYIIVHNVNMLILTLIAYIPWKKAMAKQLRKVADHSTNGSNDHSDRKHTGTLASGIIELLKVLLINVHL